MSKNTLRFHLCKCEWFLEILCPWVSIHPPIHPSIHPPIHSSIHPPIHSSIPEITEIIIICFIIGCGPGCINLAAGSRGPYGKFGPHEKKQHVSTALSFTCWTWECMLIDVHCLFKTNINNTGYYVHCSNMNAWLFAQGKFLICIWDWLKGLLGGVDKLPHFSVWSLLGHQPVNRDGGEREAAGVHGEVDEEVHHLAHEGAEHPPLQGVDGGLERDAEDDEEEVGHAQVEDEEVGRVVSDLAAPQQHGQHQAVADGAQQEDEGEDHRHDHAGGVQLVGLGRVRLPPRLAEILKIRHFASLEQEKREDTCVKENLNHYPGALRCCQGGNLKSGCMVCIDRSTRERDVYRQTFQIRQRSWQWCTGQLDFSFPVESYHTYSSRMSLSTVDTSAQQSPYETTVKINRSRLLFGSAPNCTNS